MSFNELSTPANAGDGVRDIPTVADLAVPAIAALQLRQEHAPRNQYEY
jgi:hypothetical protein